MKNAITVVMTAEVVDFAKRVKLGVALPPETKLPITRPMAATVVMPWFLAEDCGNTAACVDRTDHGVASEDCDQRY